MGSGKNSTKMLHYPSSLSPNDYTPMGPKPRKFTVVQCVRVLCHCVTGVGSCDHNSQYTEIWNYFIIARLFPATRSVLPSPHTWPCLTPGKLQSAPHLANVVILRILCKWNCTACDLLVLTFFFLPTQRNALESCSNCCMYQ